MKILIKDQDGNIAELIPAASTMIPSGWELVPEEDNVEESRKLMRAKRLRAIRAKRNQMLKANDEAYLIASKKGEDLEVIKADAQILRDLPVGVESDLDQLITENDIQNYDPFPSLGLSREY